VSAKKVFLYSLTTSYVESSTSERSHFVHVLNSELVNLGIKVKTITPHSKGSLEKEKRDGVIIKRFRYLPEKHQINSLPIPEAVNSKTGIIKVILMTMNFFIFVLKECLKEQPDIFHGHWAFPSGYFAFIFSKIFRKKCFVTIHGSDIPLLKRFEFIRKIVVHSLNNSSLIIANSQYIKDGLINLGVKNNKIVIIRVPPDFVEHGQSVEELKEFKRNFSEDSSKIVLFVGRLVEVKGVEYLIKSLLELQSQKIHLIIVGNGVLMEKLQNLTKSLNLESKITFFGRANRKELGLLYGISDVFVCPSIIYPKGANDACPLVIPEAMEYGLPVIACTMINNENNGLLVNEKDPHGIANGITKILSNKELKTRIIENSKKTVEEFSPSLIAKKHYEIFQLSKLTKYTQDH